ncbi:hypothetical protein DYB32_003722 [Aphanomyces invadans]|uniref:Uncharacterized protein n=1 Tax=Aphanomyces invadans TaxID=157072 RepID=A0A3R6Z5X4_9STRA|nr:hypothetical protein DYB32_003722 [Aphanomyces invadans]
MTRFLSHVTRTWRRIAVTSAASRARCMHASSLLLSRKQRTLFSSRVVTQFQLASFATSSTTPPIESNPKETSVDLWNNVNDLYVRAQAQDASAQYELALMFLEDDDDAEVDVDDEWSLDAETLRQRASASSSNLQDIKSIRKHARKLYKEYRKSKQPTAASKSPLVARTTSADLDDAYGSITQPLLDNSRPVPPLTLSNSAEVNEASIMEAIGGRDAAKGIAWLRRAADNGCDHPTAVPTPTVANLPLAMDCFMKAAEIGDPSAQYFMGHVLHVGNECVPANPVSSRMLIEQAAGQGHGGALYYLAQLHLNGDDSMGIPIHLETALKYLHLAVDQDEGDAMVCLADIYREGQPPLVSVNVPRAHKLYERAAALGHPEALCTLGALAYANRLYEQAFQYYQAAADRHSMAAWKNLADMYYAGVGVPQNKKTAESILDMLRKMEL